MSTLITLVSASLFCCYRVAMEIAGQLKTNWYVS